jgi:hypothetical protein
LDARTRPGAVLHGGGALPRLLPGRRRLQYPRRCRTVPSEPPPEPSPERPMKRRDFLKL